MNKVKIVNKKKFMLSMIVLMIMLFFMVSNVFAVVNRVEGYEGPKYKEVVVKSGDTVWGLAREHGPKNRDVRMSIHTIGIMNNLGSYDIFPGQTIKIPIE